MVRKTYNVWRFIPEDCRLAHGDGRLVVAGRTLRLNGRSFPKPGYYGFHGALTLLGALECKPGWAAFRAARLTSSRIAGLVAIPRWHYRTIVVGTTLHTDWIATVEETREFLERATGQREMPGPLWARDRAKTSEMRDEFELRANRIFHEMFGGTQ